MVATHFVSGRAAAACINGLRETAGVLRGFDFQSKAGNRGRLRRQALRRWRCDHQGNSHFSVTRNATFVIGTAESVWDVLPKGLRLTVTSAFDEGDRVVVKADSAPKPSSAPQHGCAGSVRRRSVAEK